MTPQWLKTNDMIKLFDKAEFTPDAFMKNLYESRSVPYFEANDAEKIKSVSENIKNKLYSCLNLEEIPCKIENIKTEKISSVKRKGYKVDTLKSEILDGFNMLSFVLVPDEIKGDAVVCLCGHGYGARQIIRQSKNGRYRKINFFDNYQKNFGEALALEGHIVICPEFFGFGNSRLKSDLHKPFYISSCDTLSHHSLISGISVASIRVYQAMKCVDILEKEYNCREFGCMGISGGGLVTLYASILDDRIEKACVCGYINSFEKSVLSLWHCPDNYIPGILSIGEMKDFAASAVPKKLMMEYGIKDKIFPLDASREAAEFIKSIYEKCGCAENFIPIEHKGKHEVYLPAALEFFK